MHHLYYFIPVFISSSKALLLKPLNPKVKTDEKIPPNPKTTQKTHFDVWSILSVIDPPLLEASMPRVRSSLLHCWTPSGRWTYDI